MKEKMHCKCDVTFSVCLLQYLLPADHLRINKINDNPKRFILLYLIFRWIKKIKLKYFILKFTWIIHLNIEYNKMNLFGLSFILFTAMLGPIRILIKAKQKSPCELNVALVAVSNSHLTQFDATFNSLKRKSTLWIECGFSCSNPHNPYSHIWKTWNQKPHCVDYDYVDYVIY